MKTINDYFENANSNPDDFADAMEAKLKEIFGDNVEFHRVEPDEDEEDEEVEEHICEECEAEILEGLDDIIERKFNILTKDETEKLVHLINQIVVEHKDEASRTDIYEGITAMLMRANFNARKKAKEEKEKEILEKAKELKEMLKELEG